MTPEDKKHQEVKLLSEFMEGISHAIGATSQMIHQYRNPSWMFVREALSKIKDLITTVAINPITEAQHVRTK